jgi:hypothetical protein
VPSETNKPDPLRYPVHQDSQTYIPAAPTVPSEPSDERKDCEFCKLELINGLCISNGCPGNPASAHLAPRASVEGSGSEPLTASADAATEREAWEAVTSRAFDYVYAGLHVESHPNGPAETGEQYDHARDAYRAAVAAVEYERGRRAERERIAGIVEGMRKSGDGVKHEPSCPYGECSGCFIERDNDAHNAALAALLDRLRETPQGD